MKRALCYRQEHSYFHGPKLGYREIAPSKLTTLSIASLLLRWIFPYHLPTNNSIDVHRSKDQVSTLAMCVGQGMNNTWDKRPSPKYLSVKSIVSAQYWAGCLPRQAFSSTEQQQNEKLKISLTINVLFPCSEGQQQCKGLVLASSVQDPSFPRICAELGGLTHVLGAAFRRETTV